MLVAGVRFGATGNMAAGYCFTSVMSNAVFSGSPKGLDTVAVTRVCLIKTCASVSIGN